LLAQQSDPFAEGAKSKLKLPKNAIVGSNAERKAAWDKLSETEQKQRLEQFKAIVEEAKAKALTNKQPEQISDTILTFTDNNRNRAFVNSRTKRVESKSTNENSPNLFNPIAYKKPCKGCLPASTKILTIDNDADGLDDGFETSLADGFTPLYHISANENSGTGFAVYNDSPVLGINQTFNANPVYGPVTLLSYYRVKPYGISNINGVPHGLIQIDYLTLWNRDDGLLSGNLCLTVAPTLGIILNEMGSHIFDKERSAALVAAPIVDGSYDTDFSQYKAYGYYTTAHEDSLGFDQSLLFNPLNPVNFNSHIELATSRWKHGTYPFNPNYLPIIWDSIILVTYLNIEIYYATGGDYEVYLSLLNLADTVFFYCVVEHFEEQGGMFANIRINVGEPANPINNSGFIQEANLTFKLNKLVF
jgi:hypothetical protein